MEPATVLALYRPRPGQESELHRLVLQHVPLLRRLGLLANAPTVLLRTAAGTFVEIFRWKSAEEMRQASSNPDVLQLWRDIGRASDSPAVDSQTEQAAGLPLFIPVSMASRSPDGGMARAKLTGAGRVLAILSLIPLVGLPAALLSILWGLTTRKTGGSRLLGFGLGGVGVSIVALLLVMLLRSGWLFPGPQFDLMVKMHLPAAVEAVEFHKLQTGSYPETLAELKDTLPRELAIYTIDPLQAWRRADHGQFYYRRIDADHYYLLSVGADGQPFTADDVVPNIDIKPGSRVGLVVKQGS